MMEVSKQIIEVMDYLANKLGIAVDWTSKNMQPVIKDICEKYIKWEISTSVAWIVITVITAVIISILALHFGDEELIVISVIIAIPIIGFQVFDIIKCNTFPELQLYEYITETIIPMLK